MTTAKLDPSDESAAPVRWREGVAVAFAYFLLALAIAYPAILGGQSMSCSAALVANGPYPDALRHTAPPVSPALSDSMLAYEPWLIHYARALRDSGSIPLWIDSTYCGAPFAGNSQSAVFYPPNFVMARLGAPAWAHAWHTILKMCLAAVGAFVLARTLGASRVGAFLAGCVFGFGGFAILYGTFSVTNISAWLPWLVLAGDRCARAATLRSVIPIAVITALQHLGGHPETQFHIQTFAAVMVLFRAIALEGSAWRGLTSRRLWIPALGYVIGFVLAGAQLVPFFEYVLRSAALFGRSEFEAAAAHWLSAPQLALYVVALGVGLIAARRVAATERVVAPSAVFLAAFAVVGWIGGARGFDYPPFLQLAPDWLGGHDSFRGLGDYSNANGAYAGVALPLALFAIVARSDRLVRFLSAAYIVTAFLGVRDPLLATALEELPVFEIAVNTRYQCGNLLIVAVLAAFGFDALRTAVARSWPVLRVTVFIAGIILCGYCVHAGRIASGDPLEKVTRSTLAAATPLRAASRPIAPPSGVTERRFLGGWIAADRELGSGAVILANGEMHPASFVRIEDSVKTSDPDLATIPGIAYAYKASLAQSTTTSAIDLPYRVVARDAAGRAFASALLEDSRSAWSFALRLAAPKSAAAWWSIAALALLVVALAIARATQSRLMRGIVAASVIGVLARFGSNFLPELPAELYFPESATTAQLRNLRPERFCLVPGTPLTFNANLSAAFGALDVQGYDAIEDRRYALLRRAALGAEDSAAPDTVAQADIAFDRRLLGLMGVRALLHHADTPVLGRELFRLDEHYVFTANPLHLARTRIVHAFVTETDDAAALARLKDPTFDLATTCVLAEAPDPTVTLGSRGAATISEDANDRVVVDVTDHDGGLLLLADTHFPGWIARVDGEERPILPANLAFRAVALRPGDRRVVFEYEPRSFWIGVGTSLAGLLALGACGLVRYRRRDA
jgi:hypothetical protein